MTDPTPLYYQTPASNSDLSSLKVLSILHYVWGGLMMLFSCIFIIYIVIGIVMASGKLNNSPAFTTTVNSSGPVGSSSSYTATRTVRTSNAPPPEVGYFFIGGGTCAVLLGWGAGICNIISGGESPAADRESSASLWAVSTVCPFHWAPCLACSPSSFCRDNR